jgi:lipopolysaccharide/colanic/teichoic acid biosynthesis glycosyltransferase
MALDELLVADVAHPPDLARGRPHNRHLAEGRRVADALVKRALDIAVAVILLGLTIPLFAAVALAIKLDSAGPVFYCCRRVGFRGREIAMLKFRKMKDGVTGPALTVAEDDRLTRVGRVLARTKLDELPQLWNVLRGQMSLVGPRPEDPAFVATYAQHYAQIIQVKPGMTGLCQLAFAKEADILDTRDRVEDYVSRLLPQKVALDQLYASRRSLGMDLRILVWTAVAVFGRCDVAVHRTAAKMTIRRPRITASTTGREFCPTEDGA